MPSFARLKYLSVIAAVAVLLTSCASHSSSTATPATTGYRGAVLSQPVVLTAADAAATFTSSAGGSATLGKLQQGKLMLVYFGYTNCPDVCPTTMADLGNALQGLPSQIQAHTQVVFVTSDPARDTPAVLKVWLAHFVSGPLVQFVGLTAPLKETDTVADSLGVPLSPPVTEADGSISVQHGAQVLAFVNGKASVVWLAGTSSADYAHDITMLSQAST